MSNDHFNSMLFLSRLLKTNDKLTALDLQMMQEVDPHFKLIMSNVSKHKDYSFDKNGILFKHLTPPKGPAFYVLCLPRQFSLLLFMNKHF